MKLGRLKTLKNLKRNNFIYRLENLDLDFCRLRSLVKLLKNIGYSNEKIRGNIYKNKEDLPAYLKTMRLIYTNQLFQNTVSKKRAKLR